MFSDEKFTVYALRCADGTIERHQIEYRTKRNLALLLLESVDRRGCSPHTLLRAEVSRSPWEEVKDLEPDEDPSIQIKVGSKRYACPRCGAAAGEDCLNLVERRAGRLVPCRWPHKERIDVWSAS